MMLSKNYCQCMLWNGLLNGGFCNQVESFTEADLCFDIGSEAYDGPFCICC